jgi:small subunit ribosomal protein S1
LVDIRPVRETIHLEGKELEFKVIKLDQKRNNVVVSRRAVMEASNSVERDALLETLQEGMSVKGIVKNLTDYGSFVDLGGVDGLLHITDMAWKRIKHPSEIVEVGQEIDVKILKFDRERNRVSLGLKQLGEDPWVEIKGRYPENTRVKARITNLTDYGCFAELEEGVEGLVHVSEMDWTNKNVHPSKIVQLGDEVEVMVLDIDEERRRISLGIKQIEKDPFASYMSDKPKGSIVTGTVIAVDAKAATIDLGDGIEGLLRASEMAKDRVEDARSFMNEGDQIEAKITGMDRKGRSVYLSIKAKDTDEEQEALQDYGTSNTEGAATTSFGDLLKEKMDS